MGTLRFEKHCSEPRAPPPWPHAGTDLSSLGLAPRDSDLIGLEGGLVVAVLKAPWVPAMCIEQSLSKALSSSTQRIL